MAPSKSRSSPTLAAAYNLRQFSQKSAHAKLEFTRAHSESTIVLDTVKAQECRRRQAELQEAWRRLEENERGVEAARLKREAKVQEKLRERHLKEREERLEAIRIKEVAKIRARKAEQERIRRANEERKLTEQRERERKKKEEEEAERMRRLPWDCERCGSSSKPGKCPDCGGKGYHMSSFFVPKMRDEAWLEFGTKYQGCEGCGGSDFGILGEVKIGSGICYECSGYGKIWPEIWNGEKDPSPRSPKKTIFTAWPEIKEED